MHGTMAADVLSALAEVQAELQAVKAALRSDGTYLGLSGESLQRYLLQLNEKENLLLSERVHGTRLLRTKSEPLPIPLDSVFEQNEGMTASSGSNSLARSRAETDGSPAHLDGRWVHKENPELVEIIQGGFVGVGSEMVTQINDEGFDSLSMELRGQLHHAKRSGNELVWDDGDVWVLVQGELKQFEGRWAHKENRSLVESIRGNKLVRSSGEILELTAVTGEDAFTAVLDGAITRAELKGNQIVWETGAVWVPLQHVYLQANAPPAGEIRSFDRDDLDSCICHATAYEALPVECLKALRAISSKAYANPPQVGEHDMALHQLLRLLAIYSREAAVTLAATSVLCNIAYDPKVSLRRLTEPRILFALLGAMANCPESKQISGKASESIARIVSAELRPEGAAAGGAGGLGVMVSFFEAAASASQAWRDAAFKVVLQLVASRGDEPAVASPTVIACHFVAAAAKSREGVASSTGWLALARMLAKSELLNALVSAGALLAAGELMSVHIKEASVQIEGMDTLFALVANKQVGLEEFLARDCLGRIEDAARQHPEVSEIQRRSAYAFSTAVQWPEELHRLAAGNAPLEISVFAELASSAFQKHSSDSEIVVAYLQAILHLTRRGSHTGIRDPKAVLNKSELEAVMDMHRGNLAVQRLGESLSQELCG
eukprot:TRINITY_DN41373_c0_g1_i1.p1 TRINITY_DN41373_c0_g1~~TRINITY_DN41373_c0_g1_i1.p1  ORF type:complete len:664 (-),score=127.37 TRINITY_DN41373_c0_g1_i1:42-2033(-)